MDLDTLIAGHDVSDARKETLAKAIELGADSETLARIRDAQRVKRNSATIVLPKHHLETLSRGSGWCRRGFGQNATWGERVDGGYQVGAGRWTVCGKDGFSREKRVEWTVVHVQVGEQTWTIAS